MHYQFQFLLTFYVVLIFCCLQIAGNLGPADITVERVEECEDPGRYSAPLGLTLSKVNRSHAGFTGCMDLGVPMDETVQLVMTAAKWGDGGWKPNAFNYANVLCDTLMKNVKNPWETFIRATGREATCPQPEGEYCVDKLVVNLSGLFPSMLYGYFRVDFEVLIKGEKHRCLRMFVKSDPAKSIPAF